MGPGGAAQGRLRLDPGGPGGLPFPLMKTPGFASFLLPLLLAGCIGDDPPAPEPFGPDEIDRIVEEMLQQEPAGEARAPRDTGLTEEEMEAIEEEIDGLEQQGPHVKGGKR